MSARKGRGLLVVACVLGTGCSALLRADELGGGDADPALAPGAAGDAEPSGGGVGSVGADAAACVDSAGPPMVRVSMGQTAYCVDGTEVTNGDYARFVQQVPSARAELTADRPCAFKASYVPDGWPKAASLGAHPVSGVDWCDAFAYCAWAKKRLCGRIGGGGSSLAAISDATSSQWYAACSRAGASRFPYANGYEPLKCNGPDAISQGLLPVRAMAACVGGYGGLFDMSGNIAEWEDACSGGAGADDACPARGGSHARRSLVDIGGASQACDARLVLERSARASDLGFRCCAF